MPLESGLILSAPPPILPDTCFSMNVSGIVISALQRLFFFRPQRLPGLPGRSIALALLLPVLAGCNNPHSAPLHEKGPDGAPWIVSYRNLGDDPRTLDPQVSYDVLGNVVISQLYESLLQYSPFKTDPFELEGALAESAPRLAHGADGALYYEVRLKRGIRFHDDPCFPGGEGREVTAQDVAYAFQRISDPKVECPVFSTLAEFIVGMKPAFEAAQASGAFDYDEPIKAVTILDSHTLRINLIKPYPQLLYWLAMPFTAPIPREAVEYYHGREGRDQFRFHPVGTGPYRLAQWARGRLLRLARHPHYNATRFPEGGWPAADDARLAPLAGKPLPFVDEIQLTTIREVVPAWLLFRQGYLDRFGVPADVFNAVVTTTQTLSREYEARGVKLFKDTDLTTFYLQFNMEDPVVGKNRKLRQAISMAYDAERNNAIFHNGIYLKAEQILPPGMIGYDAAFRNVYRDFNLEKAKALLAEAGYPDGIDPETGSPLELTLDVVGDSSLARRRAEFDQSQITHLGIRCRVVENTWESFQNKMNSGNFQMNTGSGWHADYPDAENFFALFYSKNMPLQGNNNTRFSNPEFDRLFEEMATMENSPRRNAIISEMVNILVEECPIIVLVHPVIYSLNQPWLPRILNNSMLASGGGLKYQTLDPVLRAAKQREWNQTPWWPLWALGGLVAAFAGAVILRARRSNL